MINIEDGFDIEIPASSLIKNLDRLTNQIWKLIPMWEKEEDWVKQLNTVIIEIAGLGEIYSADPRFLSLLAKLKGLRAEFEDIEFDVYRKTVFESISLIQEIKK